MKTLKFRLPWIHSSTATSMCCALAICMLLPGPASRVEAIERASSKQCSNPAFVLESFRTEELPSTAQSDLHIASEYVTAAAAMAISRPCSQYLMNFLGSTYTFSTGVKIGPNRASDGLEAKNIDIPFRQASRIQAQRIYSSVERIAVAGDGRSVDLFLSSSDGHSEVSIITTEVSGVTNRSVLLKSDTTFRSVGWIASRHGDQGGLYVLEEDSGLVGHVYVLKIKDALVRSNLKRITADSISDEAKTGL